MLRRILKIVTLVLVAILIVIAVFLAVETFYGYRPGDIGVLTAEPSQSVPLEITDTISVITWNIGYAGLGREMNFFYDGGRMVRPSQALSKKYLNGIIKWLNNNPPADIYFFQEVDLDSRRSFHTDQHKLLSEQLQGYSSVFAVNYDVPFVPSPFYEPMGKVLSGISVFSRSTPDSAFRYAFRGNYPWPEGLFFPDRCFILNRYLLDMGKQLVVVNTHNSAFDDGSLRDAQMDHLSGILTNEYEKGNYVIAGGDWNLNPPEFHTYLCTTGDAHYPVEPEMNDRIFPADWKWAYDPEVPSNRFLNETYLRTRTYTTTLDFFLVSPNVEVLEVECFDLFFENSDHHPVQMLVKLR